MDSKHSMDKTPEHFENEKARRPSLAEQDPFDYDKLNYGQSGLSGLLSSPYVFGAAFLASMGGFSFGYDQGVISLILTMDQFHASFPETAPNHAHSGFYVGVMTSLLELGAFLGCIFYPLFADRFSRKWGLSAAVVWFCVGAIIQTASQNYGMLVAGRMIGGIGVGTLALGAPLYISEVAPPNLRGSLLVLETFSIVIGAIIAYWMTYGTAEIQSEWAWRLPFLLQMVPALMVGFGIHLFPFSPRWLVMRNRNDESLQSLCRLRAVPADDERVQIEWKGIIADVRLEREVLHRRHGESSGVTLEFKIWYDLFTRYKSRTFVAVGVMFFQQFSGINAFVYYAPTLFAALGQDEHHAIILSGMINICQLVGACVIILVLDQVGRRKLAIFGGIGMMIPHAILAGLVGAYNTSWQDHPGPAWFGVALIYVYVLMYSLSYGPLGWTLPAEVYPNAVRAKGVGLAVATNWVSNFIIGLIVPQMVQSIGFGTYIFFACWCALAAVWGYFLVPETSKLTLEQIDGLFNDGTGEEESIIKAQVAQDLRS